MLDHNSNTIDYVHDNEEYRERHMHVHTTPSGKNSLGSAEYRGLITPLLSTFYPKDLVEEKHQFLIRFTKNTLLGAVVGVYAGIGYEAYLPKKQWEVRKLALYSEGGPFSGKYFKFYSQLYKGYAMGGAACFLAHSIISEFLRHHGHNYGRPRIFDDMISLGIIGGGLFFAQFGLRYLIHGVVAGVLLAPLGHLIYDMSIRRLNTRPLEIHYAKGVSQEEIEKFAYQDEIECLGVDMYTQPGHGYQNWLKQTGL